MKLIRHNCRVSPLVDRDVISYRIGNWNMRSNEKVFDRRDEISEATQRHLQVGRPLGPDNHLRNGIGGQVTTTIIANPSLSI